MKFAPYCAVMLVVWGGSVLQAQVVVDQAATAGESYARGVSGIISAQGQRNLDNSQAAINATEARSNQIDNQVKSVNAYWEKKSIYQEHVDAEMKVVQEKRERYVARRGSLDFAPEEFDRTTGAVSWPKILMQSSFDPFRTTLDTAFHERSYNGALTGDQYMAATTAYNDWRGAILNQRSEFPAPIVQQMLRFLIKVKRELDDNLS
jgi:hypothetical protein